MHETRSHIISFWPGKYGHCLAACVFVCVCEFVMDIATYRMRVCYNFKHLTFVLVNKRSELHVCPARGLAWLLIICKQQHCCCCSGSCCCNCCCCCVECLLLSELPMRAICILINVAATCNDCKLQPSSNR